jgi:uncharacterized membrane protein
MLNTEQAQRRAKANTCAESSRKTGIEEMKEVLTEKPNAETLPRIGGASAFQDGRYMPPPQDKDGKQWIRTSVLVQAEPAELYAMWHQLEEAPLWQEQIESVVRTGPKTSRWTMRNDNSTIEWDSEILADEPVRRIAWRAVDGDVQQAGEVIFEPAPGGRGTIVTVLQEFGISKLTSAIETLTGRNPKQSIVENLRHFKALAETGEIPRVQGQPHGPRGLSAKVKASMYGEAVKTPPGYTETVINPGGRKAS